MFLYSVDWIVFILRWNIDGSVLFCICKDYCCDGVAIVKCEVAIYVLTMAKYIMYLNTLPVHNFVIVSVPHINTMTRRNMADYVDFLISIL